MNIPSSSQMAKREQHSSDEEDFGEDQFDDSDFIDQDVEDDGRHIEYNQGDAVSRTLLFLVQELGEFKTTEEGQEVYVPGKSCDSGIKDIVKLCRNESVRDPHCKYNLGKWKTMRKDFLPLLLSQAKNKKLLYHLLTIISYLTSQPDADTSNLEEHKGFLEEYKELLSLPEVADILVVTLGDVLKAEPKTKYHDNTIELILTIIRNVLQIEAVSHTAIDAYKDSIQRRLYHNFSKSGGVFDAIVFMCQDMDTPLNKRLRLIFLEILYNVFASFPISFVLGGGADREFFKILREKERLNSIKRKSELSSRHSRFGAMFLVSRKIGSTSAITSSVNFSKDDLNKLDTQRIKPKPNSRYAPKKETDIFVPQIVGAHRGQLSEDEKALQIILRRFVLDFLEHAYGKIIDCVYEMLSKEASGPLPKDFLHFFVVMGFGIEYYTQEFEGATRDRPAESNFVRTVIEDSLTSKFSFIIHGIQVTLIDLLYKCLVNEVGKKKNEFDIKLYHSCLYYFNQVLSATHILARSTLINDQKNAGLLKQIIFSKEFAKILKIGFDYYEPKLHGPKYVESLVTVQDNFFTLLSSHAKDRILLAKTDKIIRRAQRRQRIDRAVLAATQDNPDALDLPQEESDDEIQEDYMFKERRYNYYSEFSSFVDFPTISKIVNLVRGEKIAWNSKKINTAVFNYISRIVNDLKGEWVFFQNDFLNIFSEIFNCHLVSSNKENAHILSLLRNVVSKFFLHLQKNPLLSVEAMFRFPDLITKDKILNDYELAIPVSKFDEDGGEIERQTIPWTKEEDMILLENYQIFREAEDPWSDLATILRDQSFLRDSKEVKFRVKLLKIDKSREAALELIQLAHNKKLSLEETIVQMILFTIARGRNLEIKAFSFLDEISKAYRSHQLSFPVSPGPFPVIPVEQHEFDMLELLFMPALLEYIGLERPGVGKVWWRVKEGEEIDSKIEELRSEWKRLKDVPERELIDMGEGIEKRRKERKEPKAKKVGKKESAKDRKAREREEINKMNRELANLVSDDEEIDLASLKDDDDDESSHQLDFSMPQRAEDSDDDDNFGMPKRRKGKDSEAKSSHAMDEELPLADGNSSIVANDREELREVTNNREEDHPQDDQSKKHRRLKRVSKQNGSPMHIENGGPGDN